MREHSAPKITELSVTVCVPSFEPRAVTEHVHICCKWIQAVNLAA